jgi:hypothetical protein
MTKRKSAPLASVPSPAVAAPDSRGGLFIDEGNGPVHVDDLSDEDSARHGLPPRGIVTPGAEEAVTNG